MKTLTFIKEGFEILFGVGIIIAGIILEVEEIWIYLIGVGLIIWAIWEIYKEVRDNSKKGDVAEFSKQREDILNKHKQNA
jgi:CDP-diglyceride synthetase